MRLKQFTLVMLLMGTVAVLTILLFSMSSSSDDTVARPILEHADYLSTLILEEKPLFSKSIAAPSNVLLIRSAKRSILIMTSKRCLYIGRVLEGIFSKPFSRYFDVILSYDGVSFAPCFDSAIKSYRSRLKDVFFFDKDRESRLRSVNRSSPLDVHRIISSHYKFAMKRIYLDLQYDFCVIFEDDVLPLSDIFSYFLQLEHLLEEDPSISMVSSLNHHSNRRIAFHPFHFYRMESFNSCGFYLSRVKFLEFNQGFSENEHVSWDYAMRAFLNLHDYHSIFPEVVRSQHIGENGTSVDSEFNRRMRQIARSTLNEGTNLGDLSYLLKDNYRIVFESLLKKSYQVQMSLHAKVLNSKTPAQLVFSRPRDNPHYEDFLKLGMNPVFDPYYYGNVIIHNNEHIPVIITDEMISPFLATGLSEEYSLELHTGETRVSCTTICGDHNQMCVADAFRKLNDCRVLQKHFPCKFCALHYNSTAGYLKEELDGPHSGFCILYLDLYFNSECDTALEGFQRLCPCSTDFDKQGKPILK